MRVLCISSWFPWPPDNGARIRTYNLLKAMGSTHDLYLVSLLQPESRREDAASLADFCHVVSMHESRWFDPNTWRSFVGLFSSQPRSIVDTYQPTVKTAVADAIAQVRPDVLVVSPLSAAAYIPDGVGIPMVLDEHDCEYARLQRSSATARGLRKARLELSWRKCARWEAQLCRLFAAIAVSGEVERQRLLRAAPDLAQLIVVPSGVDTDHYSAEGRRPGPGRLVYNGALTYGVNLQAVRYFASQVYPILQRTHTDAKLMVTGRTKGVDLTGLDDCPGVGFTGYVDDIRDVLRQSAVCVVPLLEGGATRLKVLEAMGAGVPIVSTSMGAEGIDAVDGTHLLIADTPAEFAAAVGRVLTDEALARSLSKNARRFVEQQYSWSGIGPEFTRIVESAAQCAPNCEAKQ